jgi:hypothetical protein
VRGALGFRQKHAGRERQEELKRKKTKVFILPLLHVQGKKKEEQCRSKRHCFALFFFLKSMMSHVCGVAAIVLPRSIVCVYRKYKETRNSCPLSVEK